MKKDKDKELDDFFRKGLEDPVGFVGYREEDWGSLEFMLDKQKKRRGIVYWLPVLGGVAALLLLFLGWWAFRPQVAHPPHDLAANHPKQKNTGTGGGPTRQQTDHKQTTAPPVNYAISPSVSEGRSKSNELFNPFYADGSRRSIIGNDQKNTSNRQPFETLAAKSRLLVFEPVTIIEQPVHSIDITRPVFTPAILTSSIKDVSTIKKRLAYRPQFALSVLAAPDINGVGSFQQSKVGTNAGLLFSAGVSKKLTITTGALYSVKPYIMGFENYHTPYQFPVNPTNVTADCKMLDIPINIGYQVYNKKQSKISIGTGLSSYIMLHENYTFNYAYPYRIGPTHYTVPKSSGYYFGVLNLNATYERQLNSKAGIIVEPYLKLPLTNIGYSQVRLQSTGVAVGLRWNLNSLSKP